MGCFVVRPIFGWAVAVTEADFRQLFFNLNLMLNSLHLATSLL
jgi:hypothetical protein